MNEEEKGLKIFVCSPFSGDTQFHTTLVKKLCKEVVRRGHYPYAPHLFAPHFLSDDDPVERSQGIKIGIEFLRVCNEVWVFDSFGLSKGMRLEINFAVANGITLRSWDSVNAYSGTNLKDYLKLGER